MIVTYNGDNKLIVPRSNGTDQILIIPGSQEVNNAEWFEARSHVKHKLEDGSLEEEWTKRGADDKDLNKAYLIADPDDSKGMLYPSILKDKNKTEARKIIERCSHIPTLRKWNDEETRPEPSLAILNQLKKHDKDTSRDYSRDEKRVLDNYGSKR